MSYDLHCRLRDRSQRLWVTWQDLLDNLLFREASDSIKELERDYKEACNEAAHCYTKQCVAEAKLYECEALLGKAVVALQWIMDYRDVCFIPEPWDDMANDVLAELEKK